MQVCPTPGSLTLSVKPLFPAPAVDVASDPRYNETTHGFRVVAEPYQDDIANELEATSTLEEHVVSLPSASDYLPYEITEDQTLVRRAELLVKRVPAYRGSCKMNCKKSPQACQNACYYQNCIRAGQNVQYTEPGVNTANRAQAGVAVNFGTPCSTWPFGQKFWDPIGTRNLRLGTDEWPMNTMQRANFHPTAATPQVALRCIPGDDNTRGGNQIAQFRRGYGDWNAGNGGRFANDRLGGPGVFEPGDWYDVEFYLDDFDLNDPTDLAIYK